MITYCFLASNIVGPVGGIISSTFVIIIITAFVCCITVVAIRKKQNRQNIKICNTQQFELQTIRSPEMTQTMTKIGLSRPLPKVPNTTLNTIPQKQNQNSVYVTQPVHYPVANRRPPPPYNESSDDVGPHEVQISMTNPHLAPNQQPPAVNAQKPNQGRQANTPAALTSFATLSAYNTIIQASKQHGSDLGNWEVPSDAQVTFDNPAYGFLGDAYEEDEYENMVDIYDEVK